MNSTINQRPRAKLALAAAVAVAVMPIEPAYAVWSELVWNNPAGGNWHTASNWDVLASPFPGVPDADDSAMFNYERNWSCSVYLNSNGVCNDLDIDGLQITLDLRGHTLNVTDQHGTGLGLRASGTHSLTSSEGIGNVNISGPLFSDTLYVNNLNVACTDGVFQGGDDLLSLGNTQLSAFEVLGTNVNLINSGITSNATITIYKVLSGLGSVRPGTNFYNNGTISAGYAGALTIQPAAGGRADLDGSNEAGVLLADQGSFYLAGALNDPIDTRVSVTAPYSATSDSGWVLGGAGSLTLIGGSTSITPYQVATFSAGAGSSIISASVNASGCSVISGPTELYPLADVNVAASSDLCMDGQTTFRGGTVLGSGRLFHKGNVIVAENSTVGVTNYLWDSTPAFISGGVPNSLTINPARSFTVTSPNVGVHGGTITVGSGGTLNVSSTLSMATGGLLVLNGGGVAANSVRFYGTNQLSATATSWLRVNRLVGIPAAFSFPGSITFGHQGGASSAMHTVGAGQSMTIGNNFIVGYDKAATFTINGGGDVTDSVAYLGWTTGGVGTVIVDGEGSTWTNTSSLYVGYAAAGVNGAGNVIVRNGGDLTVLNNRIGVNSGSAGTFTVTGVNSTVAHSGAGSLTIGASANSSGRLNVESGAVYNTNAAATTINHTGTLNINGGVFNAGANVTVTGGRLIRPATGQFNLASGRTLTVQSAGYASFTGSYNLDAHSVVINGTNSTWSVSDVLYVGLNGAGTMNITNGGVVGTGAAYLGRNVGSTGSVAIAGFPDARWQNSGDMWVGGSDTAAQGHATITVGTTANPGGTLSVGGTLTNWSTGTVSVGPVGQLFAGGMVNHGRLLATGGSAAVTSLDGTGTTSITGPATLNSRWVRQNHMTIATGSGLRGLVSITPNATPIVSVLKTLVIDYPTGGSPQGTVDLSNNALVLDYTGASPQAAVRSLIIAGYAGGAWNGPGIRSSTAAVTPQTGIGYGEAASLFSSFPATFMGQSVDGTSLLTRYTLYGDANLDGTTNLADFSILAANFNTQAGWSGGDFNYDGTVGIGDLSLLASNFNRTLSGDLPRDTAVVPEPTAGLAALIGLLGISRRRRSARR